VDSSGVGAANQNDHIVIDGNWINVGKKLGGCCSILLHAAQNVTISNNTIGPTCCGADVPSSPEGIRIGKPSSAAADCTTEACNITITNNLMQFISDNATHWPVSGFGSAPEATCANSSLCHQDAIHIWGCELCHINYNRLYGNACTGIFLEGTSGSTMSSMEMIGNAITAMANQCNGGVGVNFVGSGWSGTWNIKFNSFGSQLNMVFNTSSTFTLNLIGNYGALYTQRATGGNAGCTGAFPATVTAVYRYNAWTNGFNCDGTDAIGATPSWFSYAAAPAVGQDMHLNGGPAVDFVPAAVTGGCPATDFDGDIPGSPCNAGADQ
jgi:parallel beta-helix repeat protein